MKMSVNEDEKWMNRCLALAAKGYGSVSPNPLVGAVVVKHGKILGEGFHKKFGEAHAEVNAINDVLRKHQSLEGATLYVNLEPCSHVGKTPPCADAIIEHRFSRVVIAMQDPNPLVAGRGIRKLRKAGIDVAADVLRDDAVKLNEAFVKFITKRVPFVLLKVAQTSDGFIAQSSGSSRWITSKASRVFVHQLRSRYDAVLVGAGTAISDNPQLTVRHIKGRNPLRVLIDGRLRTPLRSKLFTDRHRSRTIVYTANRKKSKQLQRKGIMVRICREENFQISLRAVLSDLASHNVASVMVEGGQQMFEQFLRQRLADKIIVFQSPKQFHKGIPAFGKMTNRFHLKNVSHRKIGTDSMEEGYVVYD